MTPGPVGVVGLRFFCAGGQTRQQPDALPQQTAQTKGW